MYSGLRKYTEGWYKPARSYSAGNNRLAGLKRFGRERAGVNSDIAGGNR